MNRLIGDVERSPAPEDFALVYHEKVDCSGKENDEDYRPDRFQDGEHGQAGDEYDKEQECRRYHEAEVGVDEENSDHEKDGQYEFDARVKTVHHRVDGIVLSERNILKHLSPRRVPCRDRLFILFARCACIVVRGFARAVCRVCGGCRDRLFILFARCSGVVVRGFARAVCRVCGGCRHRFFILFARCAGVVVRGFARAVCRVCGGCRHRFFIRFARCAVLGVRGRFDLLPVFGERVNELRTRHYVARKRYAARGEFVHHPLLPRWGEKVPPPPVPRVRRTPRADCRRQRFCRL